MAESAGGAQQKLFLLETHNRMESHSLGLDWVVNNVSWMEVGKEKLDALQQQARVGRSWRESGMGGGADRKSEAAGSCLSWF